MKDFKAIIGEFDKIYIQTHNNPDADAIASAWGMKKLAEHLGKTAEIICGGTHVYKPNIDNMLNKYRINLSAIGAGFKLGDRDLLIVVDGQYGGGNVVPVVAENVAVIDHHLEERPVYCLYQDIQPKIGACTTIIAGYLKQYGVPVNQELATVLYFGIFMDTDMFTGKMTTLDQDARRELEAVYDKKVIDYLRLSSMSFEDLKTYANGILQTERYNGIVFSCIEECDDNLLGHISDLMSEIDGVDIVVVYSPRSNGYKFSVRSYHDYLTADELVKELAEGIGSGGGHRNKAGGFIMKERFDERYRHISVGLYFRTRIIDYCREVRLLKTGEDDPFAIYGRDKFFKARKKKIYLRYLKINDYFDEDVTVKTLEGVATATVDDNLIIGVRNEIWPISGAVFKRKYEEIPDQGITCLSERHIDEYGITVQSESRLLRITQDNIRELCNVCLTSDEAEVVAVRLNEKVKVRTSWGDFLAKRGDYLLVNSIDDYYICDATIFGETYDQVEMI